MRYTLSTTSARAAGLPEATNSARAAGRSETLAAGPGAGEFRDPPASSTGHEDGDEEEGESDDDSGEDEGVVGNVPLGELPSLGSAKHAEGACKRCCFFPKGRCLNGYNCEFCHYDHEKRKRKKKKKGKKDCDEDADDDSDLDVPTTPLTASQPAPAAFMAPVAPQGFAAAEMPQLHQLVATPLTGAPLTAPPPAPAPSFPATFKAQPPVAGPSFLPPPTHAADAGPSFP